MFFFELSFAFLCIPGEVKSVVFSGKAPVDSHCTIKDKTHVFTEGDDIWDVMLNQVQVNIITVCSRAHLRYETTFS